MGSSTRPAGQEPPSSHLARVWGAHVGYPPPASLQTAPWAVIMGWQQSTGEKISHKWVVSTQGHPPSFWHSAEAETPRQQEEQGAAPRNTPCCLQSTFIHNQKITYHTITQARTAQPRAPSPPATMLQPRLAQTLPHQRRAPARGAVPPLHPTGCSIPIPLRAQPHTWPEEPVHSASACVCVSPNPPLPPWAPHALLSPTPPCPILLGASGRSPTPVPTLRPPSGAGVGSLYSMAVRSPGPGALVLSCGAGRAAGSGAALPSPGDNKVLISEGAEHLLSRSPRSAGKRVPRLHLPPPAPIPVSLPPNAGRRACPWHPGVGTHPCPATCRR